MSVYTDHHPAEPERSLKGVEQPPDTARDAVAPGIPSARPAARAANSVTPLAQTALIAQRQSI